MNVSRRYPARLVLTLAAAALVLVIGAAAAFGQGSGPSGHASGGGGVSGSSGSIGVAVPGTVTVGTAGRRRELRHRRPRVVLWIDGKRFRFDDLRAGEHGRPGSDRSRCRHRRRREGCDRAGHGRRRCRRYHARPDHRHAGFGDALLLPDADGGNDVRNGHGNVGIVTRIVGHRWHGARSRSVLRLRERDDDLVPRLRRAAGPRSSLVQ